MVGEDRVRLDLDDILAATPGLFFALLSARGTDDAETIVLEALDDSAAWRLGSADGDLLVVQPNGSIRFAGIDPAGIDSFRDVAGAVEIERLAQGRSPPFCGDDQRHRRRAQRPSSRGGEPDAAGHPPAAGAPRSRPANVGPVP